ncbi:hypothetical protein J1N10_01480 [Carboxylicivirga sp. A043]|uniref:hypothetical protein n=1 Tax=Carboxylicivirga litoralis TaxID=2816963 RepID=UPI0021CB1E6E|nr:hypothetical protein [Carboxylicivirga sp. A043]MCU4154627.1 hypothetical protein [Carboxylicivirga sp. A043]
MKSLLIVSALFFALALCNAQNGENLVSVQQVNFDQGGKGNIVFMTQVGQDNQMKISQKGEGNVVIASQLGDNNVFKSEQDGNKNRILHNSYNNNNVVDILQIGDGNVVENEDLYGNDSFIEQYGDGNGVTNKNYGSNGSVTVMQMGSGNEITGTFYGTDRSGGTATIVQNSNNNILDLKKYNNKDIQISQRNGASAAVIQY